jgi:predicted DNA binding CopG/RHH family protein
MNKLNSEEKEILEAFDKGELKRSKNIARKIEQHKVVAGATLRKDARINIRLSSRDLRSLQTRALREGMPYQTLVSSVLHKFVDGQLVDKTANK